MRLLFYVPCYIGRGSGGCRPPQGRGRGRWISFSGDPSWSSRSSSSWSPQQSWRGVQVAVSAPAIVAKAEVFNFIIAQTFNLNLHFNIRRVNTSVQASELRRSENVVLICCCVLTWTDGTHVTEKHWDGGKMSVQRISTMDKFTSCWFHVEKNCSDSRFHDMNVRLWGG